MGLSWFLPLFLFLFGLPDCCSVSRLTLFSYPRFIFEQSCVLFLDKAIQSCVPESLHHTGLVHPILTSSAEVLPVGSKRAAEAATDLNNLTLCLQLLGHLI